VRGAGHPRVRVVAGGADLGLGLSLGLRWTSAFDVGHALDGGKAAFARSEQDDDAQGEREDAEE